MPNAADEDDGDESEDTVNNGTPCSVGSTVTPLRGGLPSFGSGSVRSFLCPSVETHQSPHRFMETKPDCDRNSYSLSRQRRTPVGRVLGFGILMTIRYS